MKISVSGDGRVAVDVRPRKQLPRADTSRAADASGAPEPGITYAATISLTRLRTVIVSIPTLTGAYG